MTEGGKCQPSLSLQGKRLILQSGNHRKLQPCWVYRLVCVRLCSVLSHWPARSDVTHHRARAKADAKLDVGHVIKSFVTVYLC